ncbi:MULTISPECIES: ankyrin repeat domain-containing protein [Helicobacter]|jgi:ankyrin repeat protein|uniref:Uncharacterized protein n=1 Tax=Helicobacter hepaticus (strain ATCC 51449 / 3B1) TaxID=235279 RepID=Q7VIP5_HELHP|nr:ankyrin repeat domain-containing protein [Helicobacter hepaticus]AAP77156.1 hypothetical protein HH_0559 [Helicobacter hepaticus ATCC 51449]HCD73586.1 ankyrin repeat domain-containing protein [Helicobacter sp.]
MRIFICLLCGLCFLSCQSQNKESKQNSIHNNATLELSEKKLLKPKSNAELESAFFKAIESGNNSEVISLVQSGVDIYARDYAGFGAVAKAAWSGNAEILTYLLSLGLSPNGEDKKIIPLLVAKDFSTAQILIESGADINQSNGHITPIERYFEHLPYMLSKGADIHLMGEANALFLAASDERRFSLLKKLLPFKHNQEAYNDALFLTLRAGEEYPYNLRFELSLPIDNNDEEAKKTRISLIQNEEAKIHRLKNAGATITPLLEQFANQYDAAQANIEILDFNIRDDSDANKRDFNANCDFKTQNFSKEDIAQFFNNASVQNSAGNYQLLFGGFSCEIKGTLKAYGEVWDFDLYPDGRGIWYSPKGKRVNDGIFKTYFACDKPKCKPCIIDQHDEYSSFSDEELRVLAKTTSCRARDELEFRKSKSQ